ncbi:GntR family transcriptional regulator [Amycolatopsis jejuensis]|uniref:GntR family transcriptional regulator n=1 Tax=Amycolatopsis jejuensis TaxID=330084 RepID=UPI0006924121|nr:GntR family transcriptional regulator [Amycolatopsis jejuensis]
MAQHSSPLMRAPLRDQIRQHLLDGLISGRWRPGDRIVERQVAAELDVSQAPVREALRELETLHLVTSAPNKGARVRELDLKDVFEYYSVRAALEGLAADQAVVRLGGDVSSLETHHAAMRADADHADLAAQIGHGIAFHRAIMEASDNELALDLWDALSVEVWTTLSLRLFRVDLRVNADDHEPIIDAFRRQDPAVGRLVRDHVMSYGPSREILPRERDADS